MTSDPASIDALIAKAQEVVSHRSLYDTNTAGGVGAAIETPTGNIYRGVCIDTGSGMGFCAEHAAAAAAITAGETRIVRVVAVWKHDDGTWYVLPPCGRCREFMRQIDLANLDAEVILGRRKTMKLRDLLPLNEWPAPLPDYSEAD